MADVKTRILLRSDILSEWTRVDPVLRKGEVAVVFDPTVTGDRKIRAKIGDGVSTFSALPFLADYDSRLAEIEANLTAEIARAKAEEAKKTVQELTNANGKALILNEADGGGIFFEKNDGTSKSFVGVNDSAAGGPDAQIYAINPADNNKGSKIDITKEAIYYSANTTLPYSQRTVEANEIATKGVVDGKVASEATTRAAADTTLQTNIDNEASARATADTTLQSNINSEATTRAAADSALDARVSNLEARGRFLSAYNANTGLPTTYPTVPTGTTEYTYAFKSGDYYIVETAEAGTKYEPTGSSISTTDGGATWTVGKVTSTKEIGVGDYFTFDGTNWIWIQNSQKTVSFSQIAGDADDNANLKGKLDALRNADVTLQTNINTEAATRATEDAKKVDKTVTGTNGTAYIFNESDGGGAKFVHNDGLESFVGVNDGGSDGLAAQIYADKYVDGKWSGAKLDVTNGGIYYTVGDKSRAERDVEANLLAVKGDVDAEATARATADAKKVDRLTVLEDGAKSYVSNNVGDGGACLKVENSTNYSAVAVNNDAEGGLGAQVYDWKMNGTAYESGTVIDVTDKKIYYYKGEYQTRTNRDTDANEIAVKGDVSTEKTRAEAAEATLTTNLSAEVTRATAAETTLTNNKLDKLPNVDDPTDPGYGYPYWFPYDASFTPDATQINLKLKTVSLNGNLQKMTFDKTVPAATTVTAGLMTAADKVSLAGKQDVFDVIDGGSASDWA